MNRQNRKTILIGWKEWCQLPALGLPLIKAKIDTGAKTSALHAFKIKSFQKKDIEYVRFCIHPIQGNNDIVRTCTAKVKDYRLVMSSNGAQEKRFVIDTKLILGNTEQSWNIELTLSDREPLRFRMLLGREALVKYVMIDPSADFLAGRFSKAKVCNVYG